MISIISLINNRKSLIIALAFLFSISHSISAQDLSSAPGSQQGRILQLDALFGKVKEGFKQGEVDLDKIKGSPYLSKDFVRGTIYHEKKPIGKLYMRYNAFSDEIEIKKNVNDNQYFALIKNSLVHCDLNNQTLIYSDYKPAKEASKDGYLISLTNPSSKYVLCKRVKTIFKDRGVEPGNSLAKAIEAKFATFTSYYVNNTDSKTAKELPKKQKKLISSFPEQDQSTISSFIKDQKINTKKEEDLIKLFNYINSLDSKS